jgi:hypothetical protein
MLQSKYPLTPFPTSPWIMVLPSPRNQANKRSATTSPSDAEPVTPEIIDLSSLLSTPIIRESSDDESYYPSMATDEATNAEAGPSDSPAMSAERARLLMQFITSAPDPAVKAEEINQTCASLPCKHSLQVDEPSRMYSSDP